jgi:opacity protein-like surface antigen
LRNGRLINYKGLLAITCCVVLSHSSVYAAPLLNWDLLQNYHPIVTFSAGAAFVNDVSQSKNIPPHDGVLSFFNYAYHTEYQTQAIYGATIGTEMYANKQWSLQTGLSYYRLPNVVARGTVHQGIDAPSSNTYSYRYAVIGNQILVEGKLLYNICRYHPYLSLGVGAAVNEMNNYSVNIQPPFTTFSNQFADHTTTSFSYNIGLGIDFDVAPNTRFGVGYRFADFGKAETGKAMIDNVPTTNKLTTEHVYAHEVLAQLSFDIV